MIIATANDLVLPSEKKVGQLFCCFEWLPIDTQEVAQNATMVSILSN